MMYFAQGYEHLQASRINGGCADMNTAHLSVEAGGEV